MNLTQTSQDSRLEPSTVIEIRPNAGNPLSMANLRELLHHRGLLGAWTGREIKVRYKQSLLGMLWAVLQPLSIMAMFSIVFGLFIELPTGDIPYPIFSYTALLPWTLLATSISFGASSLVNNMPLVTKIYFPREILPLSSVGAALVDFLVASVVFVGMLIVYQINLSPTVVLVPVLLLVQMCLTIGISLALSAIMVRFRDIRFVVPLALQLWMYASPVIYPLEIVPERLQPLYLLNPMATLLVSYRSVILLSEWPPWPYLLATTLLSVVMCTLGYAFFKRAEGSFADLI